MTALFRKTSHPARRITILGLGIGLYVAMSLALQVPFFENYYLCLGYTVLVVFCCFFGPAAGAIVGALGCVLHCLAINGMRGMPGWALGNLFTGVVLGLLLPRTLKKPPDRPQNCGDRPDHGGKHGHRHVRHQVLYRGGALRPAPVGQDGKKLLCLHCQQRGIADEHPPCHSPQGRGAG